LRSETDHEFYLLKEGVIDPFKQDMLQNT